MIFCEDNLSEDVLVELERGDVDEKDESSKRLWALHINEIK